MSIIVTPVSNAKTELSARVITYQGDFDFTGTEASAAIAAVRAHQDILAKAVEGQDEYPVQIPYTSVAMVTYRTAQVESSTEDDNCKVQTPAEEVASLKLDNPTARSASVTVTLGDTSINGAYGGMTFTNGVANVTIPGGGSVSATGLADGITYTVAGDGYATHNGTIPETYTLEKDKQ